jgi:hypothetical protein
MPRFASSWKKFCCEVVSCGKRSTVFFIASPRSTSILISWPCWSSRYPSDSSACLPGSAGQSPFAQAHQSLAWPLWPTRRAWRGLQPGRLPRYRPAVPLRLNRQHSAHTPLDQGAGIQVCRYRSRSDAGGMLLV